MHEAFLYVHIIGGLFNGSIWVVTLMSLLKQASLEKLKQLANIVHAGALLQVLSGFGLVLSQSTISAALCMRLTLYLGLLIVVEIGLLTKLRPVIQFTYVKLIPLVLMGGLVVTSWMRLS